LSEPRILFALTRNENVPTGGVRQAYRQVDILNDNGMEAAVVLPGDGKPNVWFEQDTKIAHMDDLVLTNDDCVVVSEVLNELPDIQGIDSAKVIVYAQNPFNVVKGYGGPRSFQQFYDSRVMAVMCVSEHSRRVLSDILCRDIVRIRYSFDKPPFGFSPEKEKLIAYMPRRSKAAVEFVLGLLRGHGLMDDWRVETVKHSTETEVAAVMKRASIFMSGSQKEGFGMPPAEAMACGCFVVGWAGIAGREFFDPEFSRLIEEGDTLSYFCEMKKALSMDLDEIREMGKKASEYIRTEYSTERETESILSAWKQIRSPRIELSDVSGRLPDSVAAYVSTYEEGPYLEAILKWLSRRVSRVYVVESKTSYNGSRSPESYDTKRIVQSVEAEGVTNLEYLEMEGSEHPGPDIKEAHERNQALEKIEKDGFKWVWIVDADELYRDEEATRLWSWFFEQVEQNPDVLGARCQWYTYWRSLYWRVEPQETFHPNVIVRSSCRIFSSRHLIPQQELDIVDVPPEICMVRHYSWARPPSNIQRKLHTWTHAHQVRPMWFEDVFMKWRPGENYQNFGPTVPDSYRSLVRCTLPVPEALTGHPYTGVEKIEDSAGPKVKVVILNHNNPENSDRLYEQLSEAFDDIEIWDSGSDGDKIPIHVSKAYGNIYWAGCWNEIMATCSDYDAVWMLGDDIKLKSKPKQYREAMESALPFGCWSPCVEGRAKPFMQARHYKDNRPRKVKNMEGMAMAVSGELMKLAVSLPEGSRGYGQDLWLCHMARKNELKNVIDGRVRVHHPQEVRYDDSEFVKEMEETFGKMFGRDFRWTAFEYDDRFEENIMDKISEELFTIVTVDNGWSYPDFIRITDSFPKARKIIMVKGVAEIPPHEGVEVMRYDKSMTRLLADADVALFPKVGAAVKPEFERFLEAKVPVVVHVDYHLGLVRHMENGYHYQVDDWARRWIHEIRNATSDGKFLGIEQVEKVCPPCAKKMEKAGINRIRKTALEAAQKDQQEKTDTRAELVKPEQESKSVRVTVITPTWQREPGIIRHCIDSIRLQTFGQWEQIVCSNGPEEVAVKNMVSDIGDPRVKYRFLGSGRKENDFGNSSRKHMLEEATGEYIMFVDDDNIILPSYMERMLAALTESGGDFAVCDVMHFGPLNEAEVGKPPVVLKGEPVRLYHIDPLQVMVKTDVMRDVGWDTEVGYLSDGVSLEKLGRKYKHIKVDELLGIHM